MIRFGVLEFDDNRLNECLNCANDGGGGLAEVEIDVATGR